MIPGRTECALALIAFLCVLIIFFFPVIQGPYPAVHGPVTALFSVRAASRLRLIVLAGLCASGCIGCTRVSSVPLTSDGFSLFRLSQARFRLRSHSSFAADHISQNNSRAFHPRDFKIAKTGVSIGVVSEFISVTP